MTESCVFCRIVTDEAPATVVYRDDRCTVFLDIRPVNPGHVLVVPNIHAGMLADLAPEDGAAVFRAAHAAAAALRRSGVRCEGVNLLLADGAQAGQEVAHVHMHVIPRYRGDGFGFRFGRTPSAPPTRAELDRVGDAVRTAFGA